MTEVWFRDPLDYIRDCAFLLIPNIIWEGRVLDQKAVDAQAHLEMHYPQSFDYRMLILRPEFTAEVRRGFSPMMPVAVYQTWCYDDDTLDDLEDMLANPPGEDMGVCNDPNTPIHKRPVYGQEHRVMITRWPDFRTTLGRSFMRALQRYQKDYPDVIIHLWGSNSFRANFGMDIRAADFDATLEARYKTLYLPSGKRIPADAADEFGQWVRMLGFSVSELGKLDKRVQFNIRSAQWAAEHFQEDIKFKSQGYDPVDPNTHHHLPATTVNVMASRIKAQEGDKVTCDSCSLFKTCKYFREGAVCSLPDTDGARLAGYFATRSSDVIIEGLGKVLAVQAQRFEEAVLDEKYAEEPGLDPNVTRLGHVLVDDGTKLAKLVDPTLAAAGAARVNAFYGGQHIHGDVTAQGLVSQIVAELEQKGMKREDITDEMVTQHIERQHQQAIEAAGHE
jgi:hypothetical protein